jgi:hypothetical protein
MGRLFSANKQPSPYFKKQISMKKTKTGVKKSARKQRPFKANYTKAHSLKRKETESSIRRK